MKAVLLLIFIFTLARGVRYFLPGRDEFNKALWHSWKLKYNKDYPPSEEPVRFAIFVDNAQKIAKHNAENDEVKLALNKFADLTTAEFKQLYTSPSLKPHEAQKEAKKVNLTDPLPYQVDWRDEGAVTPVKFQDRCGSGWAFSATGAIEGFYFINNGKLLSFSEQQLVDCDDDDYGCDGGWTASAIEYAGKHGLELETDYPYKAKEGKCKYDSSKAIKTNKGCDYVPVNSTVALKTALVEGPVAVAIQAGQEIFQFYKKGVISKGCGAFIDHAVLAVGYQWVDLVEAFIIKNSWDDDWGVEGYAYISSNQEFNKGKGACGILTLPVSVN